MRKRHLISIVLVSLFLSVCLNSSIANTVVPFATSVACIHGTNMHTVPRQETVTGWDSNNHWIGTNNYEDCSVAGCNGTSFTGQSLINYPHIKPTKHSSESCSGGYHTFYAKCAQSYCNATIIYARVRCNGSNHPSPNSIPSNSTK